MLSLFTAKKQFDDPWIGHAGLNRHGLHQRRMVVAEGLKKFRRSMVPNQPAHLEGHLEALDRDGYVAINGFLPDAQHKGLVEETDRAVDAAEREAPVKENLEQGFGAKRPFNGGFDRYDGGTLNRFIDIDPQKMPNVAAFTRNKDLSALTRSIVGLPHQARKTNIYFVLHGKEEANPDLQKEMHRDTFFSAMKFWYFPKPVEEADGPFVYVPGSHKLDAKRLAWEQENANEAIATHAQPNIGGSFRVREEDLAGLGLPAPVAVTCPGNTLVIANVLGFHRRGHAEAGRKRLSLYGWQRPHPFSLLAF